jgi:tetratricopeptide (TPR) repeat protein
MSIRPGYRFADWYIFANPEGFLQSVRATNILHSPISGGSDRETIDLYTVNEEYGPDDVIALMARAEEYGMQKQTTLALADWISVIKLEPENENAYFEAVKCYYKLAEYSDAVDMLEHCLKLTKGTEYIHAEELKKLLEKSITLRDSFHIDPVATLPYDVLDLIFSLLPFKSRVQCASVSFSWRSFFHNWAGIWQVLDFDGLGMSGSKMLRYTKDANEKGLQRLSMNRADPITVQGIFEALVEKPNPHLIHLGKNCKIAAS